MATSRSHDLPGETFVSNERILLVAQMSNNAVRYQVLNAAVVCVATIFLIPLIPVILPFARWYWTRHYRNLQVILTSRDLKVHRGIFIREEKTIPLEKITDLAVVQGPVMRRLDVKGIKVETAGQSSGAGALVNIVGIAQTDEFRDSVLRQRDRVADGDDVGTEGHPSRARAGAAITEPALLEAVIEIRDALRRIEGALSSEGR
jgi:putative membrane protein